MLDTQNVKTYHQALALLGLGYTLRDKAGRRFKLRVLETEAGTLVDFNGYRRIDQLRLPARAIDAGVSALELRPVTPIRGSNIDVVILDDLVDSEDTPKLRDDLTVYGTTTGRINRLDAVTGNAFLEHKTQRKLSEPNRNQEELRKFYMGMDFALLEESTAALMVAQFNQTEQIEAPLEPYPNTNEEQSLRKPYIPVGRYALRIFGEGDKKLMEISSPFERTSTIALADYLAGKPTANEAELMVVLKNARPDHQQPTFLGDGIDLAQNIFDELAGETITSVKVFLVAYDTKLNPWYPK